MTGDKTFATEFKKYVKKSVSLCDPEDFVGNIPFNRYCEEKDKYMIYEDEVVPYKLLNRRYILNFINYRYPTHKLSFFYKIITNDINISHLELETLPYVIE